MRKVVFVIDGWFMRKRIHYLKSFPYTGEKIREYCLRHLREGDALYRIFYYDTKPLDIKVHHPITQKHINFGQTQVAKDQNDLLASLRSTPNFALRLGQTMWHKKKWQLDSNVLRDLLKNKIKVTDIQPTDVTPAISQKAVDMKMGLDIAFMATRRVADILIIITGDQDIVPALKFARREGMQVGLDPLWNPINPELNEHVDFLCSCIPNPNAPPKKATAAKAKLKGSAHKSRTSACQTKP